MTSKNLFNITTLILILFCLNACDKVDDNPAHPQQILVEGEGGRYGVEINALQPGWIIAEVLNKDADRRIFGNVYSTDGHLVSENNPITMSGNGRIESVWSDKGFIITRNSADSLIIEVLENATGEPFAFGIILRNDNSSHEIIVQQKPSEGYQFADIEYLINEGDNDSLFTRTRMRITYNTSISQTMSFSPYGGIDVLHTSYFESSDRDAFVWISKDSVLVDVPESICEGKVHLSNKKNVYGAITRTPYMEENPHEATLEIPAGKKRTFHVELEYRKRIVSYRLTLINNRTKNKKKVEGKWIEETPTGNYNIVKNWE